MEVGAGMAVLEAAFPRVAFLWPEFAHGGDGIALVAAGDLPGENAPSGPERPPQLRARPWPANASARHSP